MKLVLIGISLCFLSLSCGPDKIAKPRPHQYPRIDFPTSDWDLHTEEICPFTIELPSYAQVLMKPQRDDERPIHPCWFDIRAADLGAVIHCSYYPIDEVNTYDKLREDAYTMASKHNIKASYRDEIAVETDQGSKGILFKIEGPVATPYQFYISDEKEHFFRGSLYFDTKVNLDSVAPVISFLREDMNRIVGSVKWGK